MGVEGQDVGITQCVKYVVKQFLEDSHYRALHQSLSNSWNRLNSLSAAIKLMEQYGVVLTEEQTKEIESLKEEQQISRLVNMMPPMLQQSNEQFQHFFLQLQLLVSTATRVRKGLSEGNSQLVEQALDDAESTGISPYILRMAIVQAGTDVSTLRASYEDWVRDADVKMGRLVRGQEDAMAAKKKLAAAQAQLAAFQTGQNEKAKKVLMSMSSGSSTAMMTLSFKSWVSIMKQMRIEREIYEEFRPQMELAEQRIMDFKAENLTGVRKMMEKKGKGKLLELLGETFVAWKDDYQHEKEKRESDAATAALNAKLTGMQKSQAEASKKMLERMTGKDTVQLMSTSFQAWLQALAEIKRENELEAEIQKAEKRVADFLKAKGDSAKKVMSSLGGGSDTGLKKIHFDEWKSFYEDAKKEAELAEKLAQKQSELAGFSGRGKKSAMSLGERAEYEANCRLLLMCMNSWKMETSVEKTLRKYHLKVDAKRQQLVQVQQMFRNFANELERGLRDGDSARGDHGTNRSKRSQPKSDGNVSLPDIHHGQPRSAWA